MKNGTDRDGKRMNGDKGVLQLLEYRLQTKRQRAPRLVFHPAWGCRQHPGAGFARQGVKPDDLKPGPQQKDN